MPGVKASPQIFFTMNPTTEPTTTTHQRIFKLAPAEDERTRTILATREQALTDPNLDDGAARMFCLIMDLSLDPSRNSGSGIVAISQTKLAEKLNCARRTIYERARQLIQARYVWISQIFLPNMKPMNVYHVSALHSPTEREYKTTPEGLWGNGSRQSPFDLKKGVQGALRQNSAPDEGAVPSGQKSQVLDIAAASGNQLPLSTAESCPGHEQNSAVARGRKLPLAGAESCPGHGQNSAVGYGRKLPRAAAESCQHKETQIGDKDTLRGGEALPPHEKAFQDWLRSLDGQYPSHLRALERKIKGRLESVRSESARAGLKRQLKAVQDRLLPPVPDEPSKIVKETSAVPPKRPPVPLAELKKKWLEAKAQYFPSGPETSKSVTPNAES